ncbi:MAG: hypothetical protein ABF876_13325 [Acetobacter aceti]|uniref:YbgF trimerisation domain-containing protein n=1 Tax=Acetobacter aceti TaxID=435 RepID=A0A1U9KGD9_ACEAC|nr:hypothetical protein [Acetobacter aceti]AQS84875.1 hypothetical protein A0U92_08905 [Acetobacter aceti]
MTRLMAATVFLSFAPVVAHAQVSSREGIALQDQIMELRQQLSQVQSSSASSSGSLPAPEAVGSRNSGASGDLVAQLLDRVNTLESQQRDMRGQLEEMTNQLKEQNASLSKQMSDMQFAAQNGGGAAAGAMASSSSAGKKEEAKEIHAPATSDAAQTPEDALKAGNAALLKHDYSAAQDSAQSALAHGKGSVKIDAQYLLGQSLAGQKQYRDSTVAYYDAYKLSPKGAKAPYALLGVSSALISLGNKKAACQALAKLKSEFPNPSERVAKSAAYFTKQGGCS